MTSTPLLSIVTPSYNQGKFLRECIESVMSQDYPAIEYIIMDGGSTDESLSIIKEYEDHLTYWRSGADGGQFAAIQEGFTRSTGEILAWINADDKYHPGAFRIVAETFLAYPEVEWLTGRPTAYNEHGEVSKIFPSLPRWSRQEYLGGAYHKCCIQQESTFWRRSLWMRAGEQMDMSLYYAGDFELWLRFFRYARLYTIDALLGGFRYHGEQKTAAGLDHYFAEADALVVREQHLMAKGQFLEFQESPQPLKHPPKKNEIT